MTQPSWIALHLVPGPGEPSPVEVGSPLNDLEFDDLPAPHRVLGSSADDDLTVFVVTPEPAACLAEMVTRLPASGLAEATAHVWASDPRAGTGSPEVFSLISNPQPPSDACRLRRQRALDRLIADAGVDRRSRN